ncbi:MAG: class I SAM-dependent methyltransferase [Candidatus Gracilibacteria bacterium]|nr:class I SAM-dependent methyltransferase [Candidatus Gracilibacteria bacterium]
MLVAENWKDYELIDTGDGEKLERWGKYLLRRPDPQVIWPHNTSHELWEKADAHYHRSHLGGGDWEYRKDLPERWTVSYKNLKFYVKTMGFKHTGIFPEQAVNWDFMMGKIKKAKRPINVLNLFAYTGAASVACAAAGASVCHIDASKGMTRVAKENLELSGLGDKPVRFIADDVIKFVKREERRGRKYEAIIMDPPSYGRGPSGETWKFEKNLYELLELCLPILAEKPLFFIVNSYTTGFSPTVIENMLRLTIGKKYKGTLSCGDLGLPVSSSGLTLPCGIFARWEE